MLGNENRLATATLMLVRASSLQDINSRNGFQAGDQYLQDISRLIRKVIQTHPGAHAYRVNGSDIAVLLEGQCNPLAKSLGGQLRQGTASLPACARAGLCRLYRLYPAAAGSVAGKRADPGRLCPGPGSKRRAQRLAGGAEEQRR
ncbi:GGDEF domain-containing protein [Oceanimonas sp. NS1]|nr:GGDEF domain-containing protein [Oceanimonas sp. NS1]